MNVMPRPSMSAAVGMVTRIGETTTIGSGGLLGPVAATSLMGFTALGLADWDDVGWQRTALAIGGPVVEQHSTVVYQVGLAPVDFIQSVVSRRNGIEFYSAGLLARKADLQLSTGICHPIRQAPRAQ